MHPINQALVDQDLLCGEVQVPTAAGYYAPCPAGGLWDMSEPDEFFKALRYMILSGISRQVLIGPRIKGMEWVLYADGEIVCE